MGNCESFNCATNSPDSLGLSCDVSQHSLALPGNNSGSFPNYPFYELGALGGSICDSLPTNLTELVFKNNAIQLFPNPVTEYIYITNDLYNKIRSIEIYNLQGQKIISKEISNYEQFNLIDLNEISTGFFEVLISTEKMFSGRNS
ncbi:MAG: T9SS type A sorting domain-containing protein [Bacteroidetes bacterium]|nr:T9SS type A sorting domain-containing protein [Bacteroidota bacterium]